MNDPDPDACSERGMAMVWVVVLAVLVAGAITALSIATVGELRSSNRDGQASRSATWAEAAAADVVTRIRSGEVGAHTGWLVPSSGARREMCDAPDGQPCQVVSSAENARGFYQIKVAKQIVPGGEIGAGDGRLGQVEYTLVGWGSDSTKEVRTARFRVGMSSLARFQMLSDDPVSIPAGSTISGAVHSNAQTLPAGQSAVNVAGATLAPGAQLSSAHGAVTGADCAAVCMPDTGAVVDLSGIDASIDTARRIGDSLSGRCAGARAYADAQGSPIVCSVPSGSHPYPSGTVRNGARYFPTWIVRLGNGQVTWQPAISLASETTGGGSTGAATFDDRAAPTPVGNPSSYVVPVGGGTILLPGDVYVEGVLNSTVGGVTVIATTPDSRTHASVYVNSASVGTTSASAPVGLVAEESVVIPSRVVQGAGPGGTVALNGVSLAARNGGFTLGAMSRIATGADPCQLARDVGVAGRLQFRGSLSTHARPRLAYTGATASGQACTAGFSQRQLAYDATLRWNPPPRFPVERDWAITEWYCTSDSLKSDCG